MKEVSIIKRFWLILAAVGLAALSGCEKAPDDAESAARRMLKELEDQACVEMSCKTELAAVVSGTDMYGNTFTDMSLSLEQNTQIQYSLEPLTLHTQGTSNQIVDGTENSSMIDTYQEEENDQSIIYSKFDEQWIRFRDTENLKVMIDQMLSGIAQGQLDALADDAFFDENSDTCTIQAVITPDMTENPVSTLQSFLGITDAVLSDVTGDIQVTFDVNKKSWLPQRVVLDFTDYGNAMISASENMEGSFSKCSWEIEYADYDAKNTITIPDEVRSQAVDLIQSGDGEQTESKETYVDGLGESSESAAQNEDGAFEIRDRSSDTVAYVNPPAAFSILDSSENFITFSDQNNTNIAYQFVNGYSPDTIMDEYKATMSYMETDENYSNVEIGDVKNASCGPYEASCVTIKYSVDDIDNTEDFICIPVGDHIFTCQVYGFVQNDGNEALIQEILAGLSFKE